MGWVGVSSVWATSVAVCFGGVSHLVSAQIVIASYLVGLVRSGGSDLALLAGRELGKITVIITLPERLLVLFRKCRVHHDAHLVVEDLGFARLGLGNEGLVKDVEDILADALKLELDLLSVVADGAHMLL